MIYFEEMHGNVKIWGTNWNSFPYPIVSEWMDTEVPLVLIVAKSEESCSLFQALQWMLSGQGFLCDYPIFLMLLSLENTIGRVNIVCVHSTHEHTCEMWVSKKPHQCASQIYSTPTMWCEKIGGHLVPQYGSERAAFTAIFALGIIVLLGAVQKWRHQGSLNKPNTPPPPDHQLS